MGIPRLTTQVHPYAQLVAWPRKFDNDENPVKRDDLILDGPSFAYHIYHLCTTGNFSKDLALNVYPTYRELGEAAINWLDELETFGFHIKYVPFDGFLPSTKINTRYERLSKSLAQLSAFRSSSSRCIPTKSKDVCSAPFLVTAICDALISSSKYSHRISTVPCEAELHCTSNTMLDGKEIILTNDSDLLLLTQSNRIMFFSSMEILSLTHSEKILRGEVYDIVQIKKELDCTDDLLLRLAHELTKHPNSTLKELAKRVTNHEISSAQNDPSFARFQEHFLPEHQYSPFAWACKGSGELANVLRRLDARVSEFVHEWAGCLGTQGYPILGFCSDSPKKETEARHMFLPFLIDDPWRASAWRVSCDVRALAYSLFALYGPRFKMMEVDRRGDRMLGVHVPLITNPLAVEEALKSLLEAISKFRLDTQANPAWWKIFSAAQVLSWIQDQGSEVPTEADMRSFCCSHGTLPGWNFVHLGAQIQSYLYSLRVLKQILDVYLAADIRGGISRTILVAIRNELRSMPLVPEVMPRPGDGLVIGVSCMDIMEIMLRRIYPLKLESANDGYQSAQPKSKRRGQKEQKIAKKAAPDHQTALQLANIYSLLEDA